MVRVDSGWQFERQLAVSGLDSSFNGGWQGQFGSLDSSFNSGWQLAVSSGNGSGRGNGSGQASCKASIAIEKEEQGQLHAYSECTEARADGCEYTAYQRWREGISFGQAKHCWECGCHRVYAGDWRGGQTSG